MIARLLIPFLLSIITYSITLNSSWGCVTLNATPHLTTQVTCPGRGAVWHGVCERPRIKAIQVTFKPLMICKQPRCLERVAKHGDRYCTAHARAYYKQEIKQRQNDPFYNSPRWRKFSKAFKALNPLCAHCLQAGRVTAGTVCDHITPRARGGADYDLKNLQTLCDPCHNRKRALERTQSI